ncbi:MAG: prepilin peptidase [Lachnospiraceae bacterium]|nr:prepilin peptidase [Lachnospiraceae bacterium]
MFLCLVILSVAAAHDAYDGRVPREVTTIGMIISQAWVICRSSVQDALIALIFGFLLLLILYPLFMIGTIGAGDIKLIMILPAYMTFPDSLQALFISFVCGACIGLVRMVTSHTLIARLRVMKNYISAVSESGRILMYEQPEQVKIKQLKSHQIHFTIPLLIGTAVSLGGYVHL